MGSRDHTEVLNPNQAYKCFMKRFLYGRASSAFIEVLSIRPIGLGVMGEYVSRIFEEVKGRPLYLVRHRAGRSLREERR